MSAGHTPGPWVVGPVDDTIVTHIGSNGVRYELANTSGDYNAPDQWPVMEANARLIAAAPDLLAALTALVGSFEKHRPKEHWDAARAAIARATGAA